MAGSEDPQAAERPKDEFLAHMSHASRPPLTPGAELARDIFDEAEALERVGGEQDLLYELVGLFLEHYPLLLAAGRNALAAYDAGKLQIAAHTLKGSAATFGAHATVAAALLVESSARAGAWDKGPDAWAILQRRLAQFTAVLKQLLANGS